MGLLPPAFVPALAAVPPLADVEPTEVVPALLDPEALVVPALGESPSSLSSGSVATAQASGSRATRNQLER